MNGCGTGGLLGNIFELIGTNSPPEKVAGSDEIGSLKPKITPPPTTPAAPDRAWSAGMVRGAVMCVARSRLALLSGSAASTVEIISSAFAGAERHAARVISSACLGAICTAAVVTAQASSGTTLTKAPTTDGPTVGDFKSEVRIVSKATLTRMSSDVPPITLTDWRGMPVRLGERYWMIATNAMNDAPTIVIREMTPSRKSLVCLPGRTPGSRY